MAGVHVQIRLDTWQISRLGGRQGRQAGYRRKGYFGLQRVGSFVLQ